MSLNAGFEQRKAWEGGKLRPDLPKVLGAEQKGRKRVGKGRGLTRGLGREARGGKKERGTQISLLACPCTPFALPVPAWAPPWEPNGRPRSAPLPPLPPRHAPQSAVNHLIYFPPSDLLTPRIPSRLPRRQGLGVLLARVRHGAQPRASASSHLRRHPANSCPQTGPAPEGRSRGRGVRGARGSPEPVLPTTPTASWPRIVRLRPRRTQGVSSLYFIS